MVNLRFRVRELLLYRAQLIFQLRVPYQPAVLPKAVQERQVGGAGREVGRRRVGALQHLRGFVLQRCCRLGFFGIRRRGRWEVGRFVARGVNPLQGLLGGDALVLAFDQGREVGGQERWQERV